MSNSDRLRYLRPHSVKERKLRGDFIQRFFRDVMTSISMYFSHHHKLILIEKYSSGIVLLLNTCYFSQRIAAN